MKIKTLLSVSFVAIGLAFFTSCSKTEGCTNPAASNYDSDATSDDGSCITTGTVTFWQASGSGYGTTTVTMNGQTRTITANVATAGGPSSCTSCSFCANFTVSAGTYSFTATDGTASWSGSATVTTGGCLKYNLF